MLSKNQKEKLRKILEKISTPDEMKSFDMEVLNEKNEKVKNEILKKIDNNKVDINWGFVENLINKTKDVLTGKIEDIKSEFKKIPSYDDRELQKKLDLLIGNTKDDKFVKEAEKKSQNQIIEELINISELLISIRDVQNIPKEDTGNFLMINQSLEGIGGILQKILSFTGSNDSTRLKDSTGTIINPATEETLQKVAEDVTIQDLYNQLGILLDRLEYGMITDNAKRLKVTLVDSGALATVTTVTTVSSVSNTARQGDLQMQRINEALLDTAFINGITNNITF